MKLSSGFKDAETIAGNVYDKYGSRNPLVRKIMAGFYRSLDELVRQANPRSIHEVGCGEGFWVTRWLMNGFDARGSDVSGKVIGLAKRNASDMNLPEDVFQQKSIYDLSQSSDSADLIVCCEVLEHLEEPRRGLEALKSIVTEHIILSVPREPVWRILNAARGQYLMQFGNTPGHLQHWSRDGFIRIATEYFDVVEIRSPIPWTMLLCRP